MANPIKIRAKVSNIKTHDTGIFTLTLSPEKKIPRFKPGQFLHLTVDEYDPAGGFWPESRVFSIASSPKSDTVEIIYSVKGSYTKRMCREISEGKIVWLKLPYGDFSIEAMVKPHQDIILVAGGTGISPYISYLQYAHESNEVLSKKIRLIYGVRKPEHILYPTLLASCCSTLHDFGLDLFIETGEYPGVLPGAKTFSSMITLSHLQELQKTFCDPVYFLSGPPAMIQTFKAGLLSVSINPYNIKIDEWE
jgi:ferredoxin-NADP reductase